MRTFESIKALLRMLSFFAATFTLYSVWFLLRFFIPNKIFWRQFAFGAWTKSFKAISGMKIEVIGTPPKSPFFLVSNHLSYTDIAAIRCVVPGVFVAKAEVGKWLLAGRIVRDMGTIFIDRANRRDIPRAGELIIERLDHGEGVIVFPEGTSTKGESVLPFNSSFLEFAARAQMPVSYASISYRAPEGEIRASTAVCWWEDIGFFAHLWRLFHIREYTAILNFGEEPVIDPDRKQLASELRQRVEDLFTPVI